MIDGKTGANYQKALAAFQGGNGVKPSGRLDAQTWDRLSATSTDPVLVEYEVQPADLKGPFNKTIPQSLEKKAELKTLNYTGPRELLAEKFHIDPGLLTRLNPKASFETAGAKILVTNVATASTAPRSRRISARPTLTDASASPIGTQRLWGKWSTREPRSISSTDRGPRIQSPDFDNYARRIRQECANPPMSSPISPACSACLRKRARRWWMRGGV
jgi:hypothetical protein